MLTRRGIVVVAIAAAAICGGFFGSMAYVESLRIRDAEPAFVTLEPLGFHIFSQPIAFHRACRYVVFLEVPNKLSDDNISTLLSLNHLPQTCLLELRLNTKKVTDASIPTLLQLTTLDSLNVEHSAITDEGIEQLRQGMPTSCEVTPQAKMK